MRYLDVQVDVQESNHTWQPQILSKHNDDLEYVFSLVAWQQVKLSINLYNLVIKTST